MRSLKEFIDLHPHQPGTLTPSRRLMLAAFATAATRVPGDFIEVGVFKGTTANLLDGVLQSFHAKVEYSKKMLFLYDSFQGLQHVSDKDEGCPTYTKDLFKQNEVPPHLPGTLVQGNIFETIPKSLPKTVAFAHIDLDLYEPTYYALTHVYKNLIRGGYIVVDDFDHPAWPGVRKAVESFLKDTPGASMQEWVFNSFPEACQCLITY